MPERAGAPVRTTAGTVVREEGACVRQGTAGAVGHVGLSMKTDAGRVSSRGEDAGVSPAQLLKDRGLS